MANKSLLKMAFNTGCARPRAATAIKNGGALHRIYLILPSFAAVCGVAGAYHFLYCSARWKTMRGKLPTERKSTLTFCPIRMRRGRASINSIAEAVFWNQRPQWDYTKERFIIRRVGESTGEQTTSYSEWFMWRTCNLRKIESTQRVFIMHWYADDNSLM